MNLDGLISYGLSDFWTLFGRVTLNGTFDNNPTRTRQNIWMGDQLLGANFQIIKSSPVRVSAQAQLEIPAYDNTNAAAQNFPFNGDGTFNAFAGGFVDFALGGDFIAVAGTGIVIRSRSFPAALPYAAEFRYRPELGFRAQAGISGVMSFGTATSASVCPDAGVCFVESPSPSVFAANIGAGYALESGLIVSATGTLNLAGTLAPKAIGFSAGLSLPLGGNPREVRAEVASKSDGPYRGGNQGFIGYDLHAQVTSVNDRLHLLKINKGKDDGVEIGQTFDIFSVKKDGTVIEAVARARVESVREDETALKITEYYKEVWIDAGFVAKRPLK